MCMKGEQNLHNYFQFACNYCLIFKGSSKAKSHNQLQPSFNISEQICISLSDVEIIHLKTDLCKLQ